MLELNKIYQGNALEVLKTFPNESINCVMTSPPYWALRDYQIKDDIVWDENKNCEHEWINYTRPSNTWGEPNKNVAGIFKNADENTSWIKSQENASCSKCGAWKGQLGLEPTFDLFIKHLCDIFDEVKRVLKKDGTCWVNLGDTYSGSGVGHKPEHFWNEDGTPKNKFAYKVNKDKVPTQPPKEKNWKINGIQDKSLCLIPFHFAIEMQNRGWILRNVIIWHKPNCMPSSIKDRFTVDFEYLFFFVKNKKYWFETQYEPSQYEEREQRRKYGWHGEIVEGIERNQPEHLDKEDYTNRFLPEQRNKRTVWRICPKPFKEAHFATYPEELCETPIKAGCPIDGIVLDPFFGAGTTGLVALKQNKKFVGIDLNPKYIEIAQNRLKPYLEQNKLNNYLGEENGKFTNS